jgi:hypothetical protein
MALNYLATYRRVIEARDKHFTASRMALDYPATYRPVIDVREKGAVA